MARILNDRIEKVAQGACHEDSHPRDPRAHGVHGEQSEAPPEREIADHAQRIVTIHDGLVASDGPNTVATTDTSAT